VRRRLRAELAVTIPEELVEAIADLFRRPECGLDLAAPVAFEGREGTGVGSAWAIGPGELVTAAHVAGVGERELTVSGIAAELIVADPALDVALVQVEEGVAVLPLPLADHDPPTGTRATAIGYGCGIREERPCTVLGAVPAEDGWPPALVVDQAPRAGDSGAPLIDGHGEIVGMWVGADWDEPDVGYALPPSVLREALGFDDQHH
jgi:S1-C subfamily serine protease